MADRGIRSLAHLQNSASTARVLNLLAVWRRHKDNPEYAQSPFFQNPRLNRTMILKHTLRAHELGVFNEPRRTATKIVFAVDPFDLKLGGRSAFVGQKNFAYMLDDFIADREKFETLDLPLLELLDRLPSFDPFLLREELKQHGYKPAACYLELSEADLKRIFSFVQGEIEPLVRMALGGEAGIASRTNRLVQKLLSNTIDVEMQPLQKVLRLGDSEFAEGIFCWKGFLYFKWINASVAETAPSIIKTVVQTRPSGAIDAETRRVLGEMRTNLVNRFHWTRVSIENLLKTYDSAYRGLTEQGNATAFRDFLLNAPSHFQELGERLGVVQHITSFCQFRFPPNRRTLIGAEEMVDIFNDFEASLSLLESPPNAQALSA